ncbi:MAG TPA: S8 family serine peptidase [Candidatus Lokiarchaeia archaeon]|nr:S8 family serine peptidase [Candidatus Lokiarchaeia archaeon]
MAVSQINNTYLQTQANQAKEVYIDPALIAAAQANHETSKKLPVIITFNEKTFSHDYTAFMDEFGGSTFILKYKFSIIPAISGFIDSAQLSTVKMASIAMSIHKNSNLSIQLMPRSNIATSSQLSVSQAANWWHDIIGLNNSTVSSLNGTGIKIGILDTGIGYETSSGAAIHEDLANKVVESINFAYGVSASDIYDEYGHGTHVAGIIAGSGSASNGEYAGVAPGASLYNLKVLNSTGSGNEDDIIKAIEWSVNNSLDIINLSLGGGTPDPTDPESMAVTNATNHGVLVVMAEGNDGPKYFTGGSPAAAYGGIAVGAMNSLKQVSDFSSRGPSLAPVFEPDVVAPGEGIISTLGANSFIEKYYGFFSSTIPGNVGSGNDYVELSGTSMATPMVVGAAALILQKFHSYHLSPAFIKASLMESAQDLGYDPCTQGMGLINVPGAIAFLEKIQSNNSFASLLRVYPKKAPYAPYDLVNFPGSSVDVLLKVLYQSPQVINFTYTGNLTGISITATPKLLNLTSAFGEKIINFTLRSAFNATPGNHLIYIDLINASHKVLDQVLLNFTLQAPRLKVYLDSFHSIADTYPWTFPLSRIAMDYYPMIKSFSESGVQIVTNMDYWTSGYNSTQAKNYLDYSWLQNFDVVIIPPQVTGLFPGEIDALVRYHEHGGNVVILGSRYQEFSYTNANWLLTSLGMGVQFTPVNLENLGGNELDSGFSWVSLTNLNQTQFLNQGLSNLTWVSGCKLELSNTHVSTVAMDDNGTGLIAMLPAMSGTGSILVSGSESVFPVFYPISASDTRFAQNLIGYYLGLSAIRVNGYISKNMVSNDTAISVYFQVFNKSSGMNYTLSNFSSYNCTLSNQTGIIRNITVHGTSSHWFGNNSLEISMLKNQSEPYIVSLNFTLGGKTYHSALAFSKFNTEGPEVTVNLSNFTPTRGTSLVINFSRTVVNETMSVTGIPLETFATRQPYSAQFMINNTKSTTISLTNSMPAGLYIIDFMCTSTNGSYPYPLMQRTGFILQDYDPSINTQLSTVGGATFASTDLGNGYVNPVSVTSDQSISVTVVGTDQETAVQNLSAYVTFYPTCIINSEAQLMPYGSNLIMDQLVYNPTIQGFSGSITIPATILGHQITTSTDYSGALIVVLRDDDGGYDFFVILLKISAQFNPLWIIIPALIAVPVVLVLVFFLVRRRRNYQASRPMGQPYPGYYNSQPMGGASIDPRRKVSSLNFCPYCGKSIKLKTRFCPYCGNEINSS